MPCSVHIAGSSLEAETGAQRNVQCDDVLKQHRETMNAHLRHTVQILELSAYY